MKNRIKQQGAAIIMALFITALVAVAATAMMYRLHIDIRRTELLLDNTKASLYAQGSLAWAMDQLNNNWKNQKPNQVIDRTPIHSPISNVNGAKISSIIYDAQGYFNLNNLTETNYQTSFTQLILAVDASIGQANAEKITTAAINWISSSAKNPSDDEYYLKYKPPYRAAHRLMVSSSELRLVRNMTPALFTKLAPYIIALPASTPINVNNAAAPVLMSLGTNMTLQSAVAIENACKNSPFTNMQNFLNFDIVKNNPIPEGKITVTSRYFLVQTNVIYGKQHFMLYTLVERAMKDAQPTVTTIWQSKGTL